MLNLRRVVHLAVAASVLAGCGIIALPARVGATHGAEHIRLDQFADTCSFDHWVEQDDLTGVEVNLGNGGQDFVDEGFGCAYPANGLPLEVLLEDNTTTMTSVGVVQVRVQADYVIGAEAIIGDTCDEGFPLTITAQVQEQNAGGTGLAVHGLGVAGSLPHCSTGSIDEVVTLSDDLTHFVAVKLSATGSTFSVTQLVVTISDPDGAVIPPECEDDPDNYCEEPPDWPPEDCETPADPTDVPGWLGWVGCTIFGGLGMLFDILGYLVGLVAHSIGRVLAAIGGIVAGILDGLLGLLGDIFGGIGGLLGSLLQLLFVPGEGLADAWDDLMALLNTKAPIGWMLQVITFLTSNLTAGNLAGPGLTTFSFSILGAAVVFDTTGVVGVLADYRPVLAALIYLACAWVIFHRIGGTLRGSEA